MSPQADMSVKPRKALSGSEESFKYTLIHAVLEKGDCQTNGAVHMSFIGVKEKTKIQIHGPSQPRKFWEIELRSFQNYQHNINNKLFCHL